VDRATVVIVSDETEFSRAVTNRWQAERDLPSFLVTGSSSYCQLGGENFALAILGGLQPESLESALNVLKNSGKPAIHVSRLNGHSPKGPDIFSLPQVAEWPDLLIQLATQILARERAAADLAKLSEATAQLEHQASLGRYILEMRHNLNNALTSVMGNSELILLNPEPLSANLKLQIETIRNMSMRMNEIMQRFSSLQKEFQLVEQQVWKKTTKSATAGA
jgi:signal transduction histidine kinase